jgi:hypothetical protein
MHRGTSCRPVLWNALGIVGYDPIGAEIDGPLDQPRVSSTKSTPRETPRRMAAIVFSGA